MSRFYVRPENIKDDAILVNGEEAHHALDVMRLKMNDAVCVFDGLGNEYEGRVSGVKGKSFTIAVENVKKTTLLRVNITVAQAVPKKDKMELIIQKCAELGARCVIPMTTERTIIKINKEREGKRFARWSRIAREASKQCGRRDIMDVKGLSRFEDVITSGGDNTLKIMPSLIGERKSLKDLAANNSPNDVIIFIGPEGGFSAYEVELAVKNKTSLISLGPYTLRSDTAAIAACAILSHELC